jgi:hypothetical protein
MKEFSLNKFSNGNSFTFNARIRSMLYLNIWYQLDYSMGKEGNIKMLLHTQCELANLRRITKARF